ncbi:MAG: DegV family protein [Anaerolineae bacterium]
MGSRSHRKRVAVVTDSTADIPRSLVESLDIDVVPQVLIMGDRTWRDGIDIDPPAFYELLRDSDKFPSSSQPRVRDFRALFERLSDEAESILAVLVSNELSGTLNSAVTAAAGLREAADGEPVPIEIIDTRSVSMQLGFIALAAARAVEAGADLQAAAAAARDVMDRVSVHFVVDTLEYLHRGGRIGAAARLFGTALNLKPVLTVCDGVVTPVAKIRSRRKALDRIYRILDEALQDAGDGGVHMSVLHVAAPDEAAELAQQLQARFEPVELIPTECGPVVGTHAGPGTVGVAYYVDG